MMLILLYITFIIIGLIPLQFISNITNIKMGKLGVSIDSQNIWNFKPFGLYTTTQNLYFSISNIKSSNIHHIKGYSENVNFYLLTDLLTMNNIIIKIYVNDPNKFITEDNIEMIYDYVAQKNLETENILLQIVNFVPDQKKTEEENTKDTIIYELMLTNFSINKINGHNIKASFAIPNDILRVEAGYKNNKIEKFKINSKDINGSLYLTKGKGDFLLESKNFNTIIEMFGINFKDRLKDLPFSIKGEIDTSTDRIFRGRIIIGDKLENILDTSIKLDDAKIPIIGISSSILKIKENMNLFQETDIVNNPENENQINQKTKHANISNAKKIANGNPWLDTINKINTLSDGSDDIKKILHQSMLNKKFALKIKIDDFYFNDLEFAELILISNLDSGKFNIDKFNTNIGKDSTLFLENNHLFIKGSSLLDFKGFDFNFLTKEMQDKPYTIESIVELGLGSYNFTQTNLKIQDLTIIKDGNFMVDRYNNTRNIEFKIDSINIEKYFGDNYFIDILKNLSQKTKDSKQIILVKELNDYSFNNEFSKKIKIQNSKYQNIKLNDINLDIRNNNNGLIFKSEIDSDLLKGSIFFGSYLDNGVRRFKLTSDIQNLNYDQLKELIEIENTTHAIINELKLNREYNIPSLVGIFGDLDLKINNIASKNEKIFDNMYLNGNISNGILYLDNISAKINDISSFSINAVADLKSIPRIDLGFAFAGIKMKDYITNTCNSELIDGYLNINGKVYLSGFNPYIALLESKGSGTITIQNMHLPKFDLLSLSQKLLSGENIANISDIIKNGKQMYFRNTTGEFTIYDKKLSGNIQMSRELVSGNSTFDLNLNNGMIESLQGTFAIIAKNKNPTDNEKTIPIYIPFAMNGFCNKIETMVGYDNIEKYLKFPSRNPK